MKACPVLLRRMRGRTAILAFHHPLAGCQIVKGGVERGETARGAALRELTEEAGIRGARFLRHLGRARSIAPGETWSFEIVRRTGLPHAWDHRSDGDDGQTYAFFWHDLARNADRRLDLRYARALRFIAPRIGAGDLA